MGSSRLWQRWAGLLALLAALLHCASVEAVVSKRVTIQLPHPHPPDPLEVHFVEAGTPSAEWPTVLLLHGARFTAADFGEVGILDTIAALEAHAVAPDLPSFGSTPGPKLMTEAQRVAWLITFMDSQFLQRVVLLACSMSGNFALPLTLTAPERVAGLVPIAAVGIETFARDIKAHQDRLTMPVLTLWGENDHPDSTRARLYGWVFPHQELHVFPLVGHACWYEDRTLFKDTFRQWFLLHQADFRDVPALSGDVRNDAVSGEGANDAAREF